MLIKLSVVIITLNEERNIRRCLESVKNIADEIVVVDSFSTDQTKEICMGFNVRFLQKAFTGYVEQKNYADSQATYSHIFSIDADEEVPATLQKEIQDLKNNFALPGYYLKRLTNYCGTWVKHGGWYPDKKLRLYHREYGSWQGVLLHERFQLTSGDKAGLLHHDLLHYSYYSISDHLKQVDHFTNIAVKELRLKNKTLNRWAIFVKPLEKFLQMYIFKAGFLDGFTGFCIAVISGYAVFIKYAKWHFTRNNAQL